MLISQMTLAEKIGQLREDRSPYETLAESSRRRLLPRESRCHLVVLVLGEDRYMIGEFASRSSLDLPGGQEQLLEQVASLHKPTVLVLLNGRPLNICWANEHLPAILEACYPGCEGGNAIANLLLGIAVPVGNCPLPRPTTWAKSRCTTTTRYRRTPRMCRLIARGIECRTMTLGS